MPARRAPVPTPSAIRHVTLTLPRTLDPARLEAAIATATQGVPMRWAIVAVTPEGWQIEAAIAR